MLSPLERAIEAWESEGGAGMSLTGTPAQIEWAERIRIRVHAEFDRVAEVLRMCAATQDVHRRASTEHTIALLEDIRADVMSRTQAGYFIREWPEIHDQVRRLIQQDSRYPITALAKRPRPGFASPAPALGIPKPEGADDASG